MSRPPIFTPCQACCFFNARTGSCAARQFCVHTGKQVAAPGFCRLFRVQDWKDRQPSQVIDDLLVQAHRETEFSFDLMIPFDEEEDDEGMLLRTVRSMLPHWPKAIHVIDRTDDDCRQGVALNAMRKLEHHDPVLLNGTKYYVTHEMNPVNMNCAIARSIRRVKSPYFVVLLPGAIILDFARFKRFINTTETRAIYFRFPRRIGETMVLELNNPSGVYIKEGYLALGASTVSRCFHETLAECEKELGYGLSWVCEQAIT